MGCNSCTEAAPFRFRMSQKDGKSILIDGESKRDIDYTVVDMTEYQQTKTAADNCPVRCIKVELTP